MNLSDLLGKVAGIPLAAITGAGALVRRARFFHPQGVVYRAKVVPVANGHLRLLGARLKGDAIVRLSTAWWRAGKEWPDVLGLAVRLGADVADQRQQDLLFATVRSPWTTLFAPLTTWTHDFLENDYYAVSPFKVDGYGVTKLRMVASRPMTPGRTRIQRLEKAAERGVATFRFEIQWRGKWTPAAEVVLTQRMPALDQERLKFSPFRAGRGIHPVGFVHALRHATYLASQTLRPASGKERAEFPELRKRPRAKRSVRAA